MSTAENETNEKNEKNERSEKNENTERTTTCGGFEEMFEMMRKFFSGGGGKPDCASMIQKCCGTRKP